MATFRDNKYVLYGIFQYVLTATNLPQNSKKQKLSSSQHMHIVFKLNVIYWLSKFMTSQHFKNYFRTQILTPNFRTCPENSGRMATTI